MKLSNFMEGLQILKPYYEKPDGYHLGAEHDQIYLYQTDTPLTPEDVEKMVVLGWFQVETGADGDGGEYDPESGWSAFV